MENPDSNSVLLKMDVEGNRTVIVAQVKPVVSSVGKPLSLETDLEWGKQKSQNLHESESRTTQIRRSSLSQRSLSKQTKRCYRLADLVVDVCLIFPITIAFWRGVWELMDYHSKQWGIDPWLSMGAGYCIPPFFYLIQEPLKRNVTIEKLGFPLFYILSRIILLVHGFGSVNQWRGPWAWMDARFGTDWKFAATTMAIGLFVSAICKTLNNILAPPLFVVVDDARSIHDCPLRFKTPPRKRFQYILDCIFSTFIVPLFVVFAWRGLWTLADVFLFPDDEVQSALSSLCIGYGISISLTLAQPTICRRLQNMKGYYRLAATDCITVIGFVGCVLNWRGGWNVYNIFLVFETPRLSEWLTVIFGAFGSMLLGCISVIVLKGIAIDGDMIEDGSGEWLIPYISHISTPVYDVPYAEPWICRFFCTSQKVGGKRRHGKNDAKLDAVLRIETGDCTKPLTGSKKVANSLGNSVHPTIPVEDLMNKRKGSGSNKNNRFHLSDLPDIDSSSEEELGMRTKMMPPPDDNNDDDINNMNINGNSEIRPKDNNE